MKKVYNATDLHQKQGQELSKKLYRTISEHVKRLDDARSCARNIKDLFVPSLQLQRRKFCDYCERLIFTDPILYGKKIEGLLWHKGFYDVISNAKRLKKADYTPDDVSNLQMHINSGIGYYHHLISKLQCEFSLNVGNFIDFSLDSDNGESKPELVEWAQLAVHQCLVYLGDLSRYKLEIYPNWEPTVAVRYYLQAVSFKPDYGMPHNQMGTLAMTQNKFLDAVYHYIRCLTCKYSFEGTTNNLHNLFDKNSKFIEQLPDENENPTEKTENIKHFIARFLLLIDIWYFNKKVSNVYSLCHQTYKDLEQCLLYMKPVNSENGEIPTDMESIESDSTSVPSYLSNDILFKIVVICLLCISKLKQSNSLQLSALIAFTLAIYSQLIRHVTNHIQESVMNYPLSTVEGKGNACKNGIIKNLVLGLKKSKTKFRRRKAMKVDSEDESEHSDQENVDDYSSSDDSFISDTEDVLVTSSDEEGDSKKDLDGFKGDAADDDAIIIEAESSSLNETKTAEEVTKKVQKMDVNDMFEIISEETSLQCIKILNDWLKHDPDVIKSCGTNTRSLLRQIAHLLNLININLGYPKITGTTIKVSEIIAKENKIPLPEDIVLKGVDILSNAHEDIEWDFIHKRKFTAKDETVIRIVKLISFGKHLMTIDEAGISFDAEKNVFVCQTNEKDDVKLPVSVMEEFELNDIDNTLFVNKSTNLGDGDSNGTLVESKGGQLMKMKHMGQLWLAAEVRDLECRVKGKTSLSPYLVLDADALIKYTFMVKHLVHSRKFIVLVPAAVVSALDDLKLEKMEARDAIRWLESQFQRGNRFFRAQRPHEKAPIPFIKYPKKRDKEMHVYIQIIECCNYLAEQQKNATNLVTLLIGNQNVLSNGENKEFSYVGLAQSIGIAIEGITQFYGKWKKTKGKR